MAVRSSFQQYFELKYSEEQQHSIIFDCQISSLIFSAMFVLSVVIAAMSSISIHTLIFSNSNLNFISLHISLLAQQYERKTSYSILFSLYGIFLMLFNSLNVTTSTFTAGFCERKNRIVV